MQLIWFSGTFIFTFEVLWGRVGTSTFGSSSPAAINTKPRLSSTLFFRFLWLRSNWQMFAYSKQWEPCKYFTALKYDLATSGNVKWMFKMIFFVSKHGFTGLNSAESTVSMSTESAKLRAWCAYKLACFDAHVLSYFVSLCASLLACLFAWNAWRVNVLVGSCA